MPRLALLFNPTAVFAGDRHKYYDMLERVIRKTTIKAGDIADLWDKKVGSSAIANQIKKMREAGYLRATKEGGREYSVNFIDNKLTRLVLDQMESEQLLPMRVDDLGQA